MSKRREKGRLGILFTNELTDKINYMSNLTGFFDPAKFIYYLIDKEYETLINKYDFGFDGDKK